MAGFWCSFDGRGIAFRESLKRETEAGLEGGETTEVGETIAPRKGLKVRNDLGCGCSHCDVDRACTRSKD